MVVMVVMARGEVHDALGRDLAVNGHHVLWMLGQEDADVFTEWLCAMGCVCEKVVVG